MTLCSSVRRTLTKLPNRACILSIVCSCEGVIACVCVCLHHTTQHVEENKTVCETKQGRAHGINQELCERSGTAGGQASKHCRITRRTNQSRPQKD